MFPSSAPRRAELVKLSNTVQRLVVHGALTGLPARAEELHRVERRFLSLITSSVSVESTKSIRVLCDLPLTMRFGGQAHGSRAADIGGKGVFVQTQAQPRVGEKVLMELGEGWGSFPIGTCLAGTVQWLSAPGSDRLGIGVSFDLTGNRDETWIRLLVLDLLRQQLTADLPKDAPAKRKSRAKKPAARKTRAKSKKRS